MRYNLRKRVRELSTFRAKSPSSFQSKEVKSFSWNSVYIYHYGSFIVFPIRAVPRVFLYAQCILYLISIIVTIFDHIPDNLIGYLSSVYIYYQDVVFYFLTVTLTCMHQIVSILSFQVQQSSNAASHH